jgi:hypothetical protein
LRHHTKAKAVKDTRAAAAVDGCALVGRTVSKEFVGEMFTGRVTSFDPKVEW